MPDDIAIDPVGASLLRPQWAPSLPGSSQIPLQGVVGYTRIFCGFVRDYFARSDSYLVFDTQTRSSVVCFAMHPYGMSGTSMGARVISGGYPPQTPVYVLEVSGMRIILGTALASTTNLKNIIPDMMVMRSQVGAADPKAPMHYEPLKKDAGLSYCDVGRPLDALGGDWGHINELGVAIFLGRMMATLRASDMAKIEAFWGDDLLRIFGYNLQTYTGMREEYEVADEGEGNMVRRCSPFIWEAIGAKEVKSSAVDEKKGRSKDPEANAWWEPKKPDQLIIPRHTLMRGYMGDIEHEWVQVPGKSMPAQESFSNSTKYVGVFEQAKNITGAYFVRSAKELSFEKSILIPVPKERKAPDDPTGDNRKDYHAAGSPQLGEGGQLPKLPEYAFPEQSDANGWFAYLYDVQAWMYNRVIIGGLYYHTPDGGGHDWYLPAESALQGEFSDNVKSVNIEPSKLNIGNKFMVSLPEIAKLKVDHRNGHEAVRYYQSRSIFKLQEDGSILIEDGYGSSLQFKGGSIIASCVGDIIMQPGRNIINWAPRDFIAKAGNCVDITASKKDIHIKAEKNLEFIAGNGSDRKGAMIFDCRSEGAPKKDDFTEIGEDRKTSGIIFKSADAPIYLFGNDCYIGLSKPTGRITLDGKDGGELYFRGQKFRARTNEFEIIGPDSKKLLQILGNSLYLNTDLNWFTGFYYFKEGIRCGDLEVQGYVRCTGSVYAKQHFGSKYGGPVGKSPDIPLAYPNSQKIQKTVEDQYVDVQTATDVDEQAVVDDANAPGNEEFQARVHFSCRKTKQYFGDQQGTFFLWETRWQNLLKQGGGATTWDEPEVPRTGGGDPEMPHPGIDAWKKQEKFKYVESPSNYNAQTGVAKTRSSLTEQGKSPTKKKLSEAYIINTQT
jgi:hypothetical protein